MLSINIILTVSLGILEFAHAAVKRLEEYEKQAQDNLLLGQNGFRSYALTDFGQQGAWFVTNLCKTLTCQKIDSAIEAEVFSDQICPLVYKKCVVGCGVPANFESVTSGKPIKLPCLAAYNVDRSFPIVKSGKNPFLPPAAGVYGLGPGNGCGYDPAAYFSLMPTVVNAEIVSGLTQSFYFAKDMGSLGSQLLSRANNITHTASTFYVTSTAKSRLLIPLVASSQTWSFSISSPIDIISDKGDYSIPAPSAMTIDLTKTFNIVSHLMAESYACAFNALNTPNTSATRTLYNGYWTYSYPCTSSSAAPIFPSIGFAVNTNRGLSYMTFDGPQGMIFKTSNEPEEYKCFLAFASLPNCPNIDEFIWGWAGLVNKPDLTKEYTYPRFVLEKCPSTNAFSYYLSLRDD